MSTPEVVPEVPDSGTTARVALSPAAAELLVKLSDFHGPLMFHQSGGCCDGSSPMCYPDGDFKIGGSDVHLGDLVVEGLPAPIGFYMSESQFEYWKHPPHRRRGEGSRQRVLGRGAGRRPIHDPLPAVLRRGVGGAERRVTAFRARTAYAGGPGPLT